MPTALYTRSDVQRALTMPQCIDAVEQAFIAHGNGTALPPGVVGTHVDGGGFHVKTAGLMGPRGYYVAKVNANFPANRRERSLPTIQGALLLFDASNGVPLAIMDSAEITKLRTAAASAVAARHLARTDASVLTVCGCGVQGREHLEAMRAIRPVTRVFAYDADRSAANLFATEVSASGLTVEVIATLATGTRQSDIVVTCTSSQVALLHPGDVRPGTFIAAVGADSESKHEIAEDLMAEACVVVDVLAQCETIGDLHHAIAAGRMTRDQVHADLSALVTGTARPPSGDVPIVFDSTGTALEDVAAAIRVFERGTPSGSISLHS